MQDVDQAMERRADGMPPPAFDGLPSGAACFAVGEWQIDTAALELRRANERFAVEPRQMSVMAALCRNPGTVMSADSLLDLCWPGQANGDNPVHKAIASLRRVLRDSATAPRYIETIRKQGYRLIAQTRVISDDGARCHRRGWQGTSPFCGLEAFGPRHTGVFFGRDGAVAQLRARLGEQWRRGHPLVLLLGPSGSGKTSLVQAGVLPAMATTRRQGAQAGGALRSCAASLVDLGAHDDAGAWGALAGGLLDWDVDGVPLLAGYSVASLAADLRADPARVLRQLELGIRSQGDWAALAPPLLVLDRLEALFQPPLAAEAALFADRLQTLLRSGLLLVLGICRNDFYAHLAAHPLFMRGKPFGSHVDLDPPDIDAFAQIIRLPARAAGLTYASDPSGLHRLDDRLCADAMRARDALPLLQYTLQSLYLARSPGDLLTWEAYDALGGLEGAVSQRAEAVLAALPQPQQDALARLLLRLVGSVEEDGVPTARWMRESELDGADEVALVRALVDARLLVSDRIGGTVGVRVAHEALLRRWPRVTTWIAQHRGILATRDELGAWVRRWREGERAPSLLLPAGATLWRAADALARAPQLFSADESHFVARSQGRLQRQTRLRWAASASATLLAIAAVFMALRNAQLARVASERELQSQHLASFMLGDLADRLRPLGKLDLLGSIGEQGVKLLGHPGAGAESPRDVLARAKALLVIGEVDSSQGSGRTEVAIAALREADALLGSLKPGPQLAPDDYFKALGATAYWLGQIAFDAGDFDEAAVQMGRYRAAGEQWRVAMPQDAQARAELGFAYGALGSVAFRRGAWGAAAGWFASSLDLKRAALATDRDDAGHIGAVANAQTSLGELACIQGDPRRALALYEQAFAMEDGLRARYPDQMGRLLDAGMGQVRLAEAFGALGRRDDAVRTMQQATAALARVAHSDPNNRHWADEHLLLESGLVLARLEAGQAVDDALAALRTRLDEVAPERRAGYLWRAADARAQVALALAAAPAHMRAALARADLVLDELLQRRPHDWQLVELRARLSLLDLKGEAAPDDLAARGARRAAALQAAVDAGHAGIVLEAWLLAREAAGAPVDTTRRNTLTAGGYRPIALRFPTTSPR